MLVPPRPFHIHFPVIKVIPLSSSYLSSISHRMEAIPKISSTNLIRKVRLISVESSRSPRCRSSVISHAGGIHLRPRTLLPPAPYFLFLEVYIWEGFGWKPYSPWVTIYELEWKFNSKLLASIKVELKRFRVSSSSV